MRKSTSGFLRNWRRRSTAMATILGLVAGLTGPSARAVAQDAPVLLKMSSWVPPAHPLNPSFTEWGKSIEQDSKGTITSMLFPSEQLGKAFDHYDMARDGIADLAYVNPGYQPGRFPVVALAELPFMFKDGRNGTAAFDSWYRKYAAAEMKDVHFCLAFIHYPGTIHSRQKITLPSDLKGTKMRPADATIGSFVTLIGGTNVQASAPESRDLLQRGTADGIFFPWGSTVLFSIDKVVKYHIDAALYVTTFVWVMNKARYDGMSSTQKAVIDNHCTTDWAVKVAGPWSDFEEAGRDKIKAEAGHELVPLTADELKAWKTAAEPLQQRWTDGARKAGVDPDVALKEMQASLDKYKAAY